MYEVMDNFMREALIEAAKARDKGEIPVGCVIVKDGEIIARGHNLTDTNHDPTAHAEINAIREAGKYLGETLGWRRLTGCDMYVTMEPCSMCAGALVWARIENLYMGTLDPKAGACGSVLNVAQEERFNHHVNVVLIDDEETSDACREIVRDFFRNLREIQRLRKQATAEGAEPNTEG